MRRKKSIPKTWKQKRAVLRVFAERLNADLPPSEKWFAQRWSELGMGDGETLNAPLGSFIFDRYHAAHKYAIEVDGASHDDPAQQAKDRLKDAFCWRTHVALFRIRAYDDAALPELKEKVLKQIRWSVSRAGNTARSIAAHDAKMARTLAKRRETLSRKKDERPKIFVQKFLVRKAPSTLRASTGRSELGAGTSLENKAAAVRAEVKPDAKADVKREVVTSDSEAFLPGYCTP